jgi:hypothetical protein
MPYADKEKRQAYINEWKKESRRKRGLQKQGRKPYTEDQKIEAKEKRKIREKSWRPIWAEINPAKRLLYSARRRATLNNLDFDLVEDDIIVPTHCPILGIPLVNTRPRGDSRRDIASLDRVDPTKGYTKDNIEVISWLANTMKNNATPELLIRFAEEILRRYKN